MSGGRLLIPNLGAEEGPGWRRFAALPEVRATARLWRLLFPPDHELTAELPYPADPGWPSALPVAEGAAFGWLDDPEPASAWLNDASAAAEAAERGRALDGAEPAVVRAVHDKAFALEVAEREALEPRGLRGLALCFDPHELLEADTAVRRILERVADWPAWTGRRFALKPRLGTSGRGRFGAALDACDEAALRRALPRLAARGGALLEPWLPRRGDFSAQLWIAPDGAITLLGTLEQVLSQAGGYLGHRGLLDARGRVDSGSAWDGALREAAAVLARAAHERGFHGPCGLDALVFEDGQGRDQLRAVVELNARFTVGTVVLGLLRRALPLIRDRLGLEPGAPRRFEFSLRGGAATRSEAPRQELVLALGAPGEPAGPSLHLG